MDHKFQQDVKQYQFSLVQLHMDIILFWLQVLSLVLNCQCFRGGDLIGV